VRGTELIPGATFTAQGDVELDLLIISAGIELAAQVNTQIHPQAYIHGSECEVGFDVERTNNPMDAYFESFYQIKKCILWVRAPLPTAHAHAHAQSTPTHRTCTCTHHLHTQIFDCHTENKDTQVWWQWTLPSSTEVLFNEDWKISL
jgi:hypothetical protein